MTFLQFENKNSTGLLVQFGEILIKNKTDKHGKQLESELKAKKVCCVLLPPKTNTVKAFTQHTFFLPIFEK